MRATVPHTAAIAALLSTAAPALTAAHNINPFVRPTSTTSCCLVVGR